MFRPRGDNTPKDLGIMLNYVRKGTMECLPSFVIYLGKATVGGGCKWVAWPLGISSVLLVLVSSETPGIKPRLDVFCVFIEVFGCAVQDWFDSTILKSF